jgi:hypothetical protein
MDSGNNGTLSVYTMEVQPSAEAIQEVAVQTSSFAAEYGAVGGGLFNATMKSGGNAYHGSAYEYFVNEGLNARQPYTNILDRARRSDYGISLGGPIRIPKIYDGTNKTFFYFNWEQFLENRVVSTSVATVPTAEYRTGDFGLLSGRAGGYNLATSAGNFIDPLGRTIPVSQIFDPRTQRPVTCAVSSFTPTCAGVQGQTGNSILTSDAFVGNVIPVTRFDPVASTIQSKYIPLPKGINAARPGSNYNNAFRSHRTTEIPSLKLDQTIGSKSRLWWDRRACPKVSSTRLRASSRTSTAAIRSARTTTIRFPPPCCCTWARASNRTSCGIGRRFWISTPKKKSASRASR